MNTIRKIYRKHIILYKSTQTKGNTLMKDNKIITAIVALLAICLANSAFARGHGHSGGGRSHSSSHTSYSKSTYSHSKLNKVTPKQSTATVNISIPASKNSTNQTNSKNTQLQPAQQPQQSPQSASAPTQQTQENCNSLPIGQYCLNNQPNSNK